MQKNAIKAKKQHMKMLKENKNKIYFVKWSGN